MQQYLGLDTCGTIDGRLQDIHWTDGSFGYFQLPLGAMYAAQFAAALQRELAASPPCSVVKRDCSRCSPGYNAISGAKLASTARMSWWCGQQVRRSMPATSATIFETRYL